MPELLDSLLNGPARYTQEHHFEPWLTLVFVIGILLAEIVAVYVLVRLLVIFVRDLPALIGLVLRKCGVGEKEVPQSFLELTFPADTTKSAFATEQLHILLQTLVRYRGLWDRAAARKKPYSLELVGTKDDGIRYVLMIPSHSVDIVSRNLRSFLPGLKIKQIDDYMAALTKTIVGTMELKLSADFVLPLQDHKTLEEHDQIAYLTGQMTKLAPDELVAFQIVTVPVLQRTHRRVSRRITKMQHAIALNKEISTELVVQHSPLAFALRLLWYPPLWFLAAMGKIMGGIGDVVFSIFSSSHETPKFMQSGANTRPATNPYEQELGKIIKSKVDQQLFEVTIRLLVASNDRSAIQTRLNALFATFQPYASTYQSIAFRRDVPLFMPGKKHLPNFEDYEHCTVRIR